VLLRTYAAAADAEGKVRFGSKLPGGVAPGSGRAQDGSGWLRASGRRHQVVGLALSDVLSPEVAARMLEVIPDAHLTLVENSGHSGGISVHEFVTPLGRVNIRCNCTQDRSGKSRNGRAPQLRAKPLWQQIKCPQRHLQEERGTTLSHT
jgi:hypothetical protein